MKKIFLNKNKSRKEILFNILLAFISLFINGFGIYLTIHASIGASPWDVLNTGISRTFNIIYGNVSIIISLIILLIDVLLKEPIGIAMIIDALTVGKSVDLFNYLDLIKTPDTMIGSIIMLVIGLFIIGYTQFTYMIAALGCGPRDTLLVGLSKRLKKIPIGFVEIIIMSVVTFTGYLLHGDVGVGTIICAVLAGPIMQSAFDLFGYDAKSIKHQKISDTIKVLTDYNK